MIIALIGPPGAGKTAVGERLAKRLSAGFEDLDARIAQRHGDLEDIVYAEGSDGLRSRALTTLADVAEEHRARSTPGDLVVAVSSVVAGGDDAAEVLSDATVCYLAVEMSHSFRRAGMTGPQPPGLIAARSMWKQMLDARDPGYRELADVIVEVGLKDPDGVAEDILRACAPLERDAAPRD